MSIVGTLAYGSVIAEPGFEIEPPGLSMRAMPTKDLKVTPDRETMRNLNAFPGRVRPPQGDAAPQFYDKALAIAERLARQEPDRADLQVDLAASLERVGAYDPAHTRRALAILRTLDGQGQLLPDQRAWIGTLERALEA
jgi:hypothetical protein